MTNWKNICAFNDVGVLTSRASLGQNTVLWESPIGRLMCNSRKGKQFWLLGCDVSWYLGGLMKDSIVREHSISIIRPMKSYAVYLESKTHHDMLQMRERKEVAKVTDLGFLKCGHEWNSSALYVFLQDWCYRCVRLTLGCTWMLSICICRGDA